MIPTTWVHCTNETVSFMSSNFGGWQYPTYVGLDWNIEFRMKEVFRRGMTMAKRFNLPPFLYGNPDAVNAIKLFVRKNSNSITVE